MSWLSLTDEQRAFQARFDELCRTRIAPRARATERDGRISAQSWRDLVEAGYPRLFHPPAQGGLGADGVTLAIAMECLGRACASTLWAVSVSAVLCGKILATLGTPRLQQTWLPPILAGERVGCFAGTEHGAGSDPASYETALVAAGGGLRLRGEKSRISNAGIADVAVVVARAEADTHPSGRAGICFVVVDLRQPPVARAEIEKLGLGGMSWGTLRFDDVPVDRDDVLFEADLEKNLQAVEWGQLLQTFCAIGLAQAALDASVTFARQRSAFGRPIAHLEVVHARLADMHAEIQAARLLGLEAAWSKGQGQPARELIMMAKINATEMSVRAADAAMRTFGGWGYARDHVVERLYRDSLANIPAGLTTDRLRELLVCPAVGVDPARYPPFDWLTAAGLRL
jgi:alkylation response protein AidB-like acyl-CoA dehydrogenase